jgi:hypothetical protein
MIKSYVLYLAAIWQPGHEELFSEDHLIRLMNE